MEANDPPPQGKPRLTEALERLVQLYDVWNKSDQAAEWRKKLEETKSLPPASHRGIATSGWTRYLVQETCEVAMTVREAIRRVEKDGWVRVRQKGSHRQFHHPTKPGTVTIAGKPSLDLDKKSERSVLRQAGLL